MDRWTIGTLLETAAAYLREKGSESPRLDAELLLAETLGIDRVHLYTEFDRPLTVPEVSAYRALIARRAVREPVAYILGRAHFRHLSLEVGPGVLIPRPETEELVDVALALLRRRPLWRAPAPPGTQALIADVGTGSGAIAVSLASEAGLRVLATDASEQALVVAARNAAAAGVQGLVEFKRTDLLEGVPEGTLHLVVSNPPYVRTGDIAGLAPDIRLFEPVEALDAGPDGLRVIRRLLPEAARALRPGGSVLLEVGDGQAAEVEALAREAGFCRTALHKDLSQKDRIVEATMPGTLALRLSELDGHALDALAGALQAGAIMGIPTDTVYGLAARWDSPAGVRSLFAAKGRPAGQPLAVVFASVAAVKAALPDLGAPAARVMEALLPGPYTFVVATNVPRPPLVGTPDSLGVRVPDHPELSRFLESLDVPVAATSANLTGAEDVAGLDAVDPAVLAHCSVGLTASRESGAIGTASTVVDLRPLSREERPIVLREGGVPVAVVLERIAGLALDAP